MPSASPRRSSSHARSAGCRSRLVVYGVEGVGFETGAGLSRSVAAVVDSVADAVVRDARELALDLQPDRSPDARSVGEPEAAFRGEHRRTPELREAILAATTGPGRGREQL